MTRGMGTALGLAVTGLVYGLAVAPIAGFQHSSLMLAGIAVAAALIACLRPASRRVIRVAEPVHERG